MGDDLIRELRLQLRKSYVPLHWDRARLVLEALEKEQPDMRLSRADTGAVVVSYWRYGSETHIHCLYDGSIWAKSGPYVEKWGSAEGPGTPYNPPPTPDPTF